jgi:transcriptional regulator with PAS, ATPase and Fis domain
MQLLVRARDTVDDGTQRNPGRPLVDFVERMADPVVITDSSGRVIVANPAFYNLVKATDTQYATGKPLSELLQCSPEGLEDLTVRLQHHGMASETLASTGQGRDGEVRLTGTLLDEADQGMIGFSVSTNPAVTLVSTPPAPVQELSERLSLLAEELGIQELPYLVARVGRLAESYIVDMALDKTQGDVERAAQLLGVTSSEVQRIKTQSNTATTRNASTRD